MSGRVPPQSIVSSLKRGDRICLKECDSRKLYSEKPFIWDYPLESRHGVILDPFYGFNGEVYVCFLLEQPLNIHPSDLELEYFEHHHDVENVHCLFLVPRRLIAEEIVTLILYASNRPTQRGSTLSLRRPSAAPEYRGSPLPNYQNNSDPYGRYPSYPDTPPSSNTPTAYTPPIRVPPNTVSCQMEVEYIPTAAQIDQVVSILEVSRAVAKYLLKKHCGVEEAVTYYVICEDKSEFAAVDASVVAPPAAPSVVTGLRTPPISGSGSTTTPQVDALQQQQQLMRARTLTPVRDMTPERTLRHTMSETNARVPLSRATPNSGSFSHIPRPSIHDRSIRALGDPSSATDLSVKSTESSVSSKFTSSVSSSRMVPMSTATAAADAVPAVTAAAAVMPPVMLGNTNWKAGDRVVLRECTSVQYAESQAHIWRTPLLDRRGVIVTINVGLCRDNPQLSDCIVISFDKPINTSPTPCEESYIALMRLKNQSELELRSSDVRYVKVIPIMDLQVVILDKDTVFKQMEFKSYEVVLCSFPNCADRVVPRGNTILMCCSNSHYVCKKHVFPVEVQERAEFLQIQREIKSIGFSKGLNDPYSSARASLAYFTKKHFPSMVGTSKEFHAQLCESNEYSCPLCKHFNVPLMAPFCSFQEFYYEGGKELANIVSGSSSGSGLTSSGSSGNLLSSTSAKLNQPAPVPTVATVVAPPTATATASAGPVVGFAAYSGLSGKSSGGLGLAAVAGLSINVSEPSPATSSSATSAGPSTGRTPSGKRTSRGKSPKHSARHGPRPLSTLYALPLNQLKAAQELVDVLNLSMFGAKVLIQQFGTVDDAIAQFTCMTESERKTYTEAAYDDEEYSDEEEGEEGYSDEEEVEVVTECGVVGVDVDDAVGAEWSRNLADAKKDPVKNGSGNSLMTSTTTVQSVSLSSSRSNSGTNQGVGVSPARNVRY